MLNPTKSKNSKNPYKMVFQRFDQNPFDMLKGIRCNYIPNMKALAQVLVKQKCQLAIKL